MKRKVNCGELSVEKTLLDLQHIVKTASETWPSPCMVFSTRAIVRDGCHAKRKFRALY